MMKSFLAACVALCALHHGSCFTLSFNAIPAKRVSGRIFAVDKLRESTGIRPSLHPTTINALAEVIKLRVTDPESRLRVSQDAGIETAMSAGKIAADFLGARREASQEDGMVFTVEEEQTIAGRVVGVVMRMEDLESVLHERTSSVGWIEKYNEWGSFGVLQDETTVEERIRDDPLFVMARAECLLALFLATVEAPRLLEIGQAVPGGSNVDFLDADRIEVLLSDFQ